MHDFTTVARVGDIPSGEGRAYELEDRIVAIFNQDGVYTAIDDMCPHMGASLAAGHFDHGVVACPWHGWSFDTRDGTWLDCRRLKIDVFQVRVVGDEIQLAFSDTADPPTGSQPGTAGDQDPHPGGQPDE